MHPTADTTAIIFGRGAGRRVIGGVRLLGSFKSTPETCRCQQRAALSPPDARFPGGVALRMIFHGASREVCRFEYRWVAAGAYCLNRAPEQANAPDRRYDGYHLQQQLGAAGDWQR
jgi:hypothetical protein